MKHSGALRETQDSSSSLLADARSKRAILLFVVFAFVWAWGATFVASEAKADYPALSVVLMILAGFGPSFSGLAIIAFFSVPAGLREWVRRCLNWRVGWRWFALAFLAPPTLMAFALALDASLGAAPPAFPAAQHIPLAMANFGLVFLIGGPLGEEFGWRGYLTPALTTRLNWRAASLVVGVVWGLWHLPLFLIVGTVQSQMQVMTFLLNILAGSVLFGWLFERTRRSLLPVLLLHTSLNAWAGILSIVPTTGSGRSYVLVTGLLVLVACALLLTPDQKPAPEPSR